MVYAYAINSPDYRPSYRSSILGYLYDFTSEEAEEDLTFDGFKKAAMDQSLLDELDSFQL